MLEVIQKGGARLVVGFGVTGVSAAQYCLEQGYLVMAVDANESPSGSLEHTHANFDSLFGQKFIDLCDDFEALVEFVDGFDEVIVSPGVPLSHPVVKVARQLSIPVVNDICLFLRELRHKNANVKVVAVTGSNGKTTVTDGITFLGKELGLHIHGIGNIGMPVLNTLANLQSDDIVVLELSSYQLELVEELGADVALLLNLSEDHLDRHGTMRAYWRAKQRVYDKAKAVVVNREDPLSAPAAVHEADSPLGAYVRYGNNAPDKGDFGVLFRSSQSWLAHGTEVLAPLSDFSLQGQHNYSNIMAILGVAKVLGWPLKDSVQILRRYTGLLYRCQRENTTDGIVWLNDSKGTNVGATMVALSNGKGLITDGGGLWWIGGGIAKGADFSGLALYLKNEIGALLKGCFVYGRDQNHIHSALEQHGVGPVRCFDDLTLVVAAIRPLLTAGDVVVFSPACASMDQFKNFEVRGAAFSELVNSVSPVTSEA